MTIKREIMDVAGRARNLVLNNLESSKEKTGTQNPFGDKTLLLDQAAEDTMIEVLESLDTTYMVLTEERGLIIPEKTPEYLVVIDPIDGSTNLEKGIPLCAVGISAVPFSESMTTDDIELSVIDSFFTKETYVAERGKGTHLNGKRISVADEIDASMAIISYDTKKQMRDEFGEQTLRTMKSIYDIRRTGSNLLDLCWTASGALDAMVDLRGVLPIVHVSGTHMVSEAGGYVLNMHGTRFKQSFDMQQRMSFIAASNENLARTLLHNFMTEVKS